MRPDFYTPPAPPKRFPKQPRRSALSRWLRTWTGANKGRDWSGPRED